MATRRNTKATTTNTANKEEAFFALLSDAGFKRWQKKQMDRMYISPNQLGLVVDDEHDVYTFGSNAITKEESLCIRAAKTYLDCKNMKVVSGHEALRDAANAMLNSISEVNQCGFAFA